MATVEMRSGDSSMTADREKQESKERKKLMESNEECMSLKATNNDIACHTVMGEEIG